eukprot:scaffold385_cov38-Cyclotella_meneghiniana.AAC.3
MMQLFLSRKKWQVAATGQRDASGFAHTFSMLATCRNHDATRPNSTYPENMRGGYHQSSNSATSSQRRSKMKGNEAKGVHKNHD